MATWSVDQWVESFVKRLCAWSRAPGVYAESVRDAEEYGYSSEMNWNLALAKFHTLAASNMDVTREEFSALVALDGVDTLRLGEGWEAPTLRILIEDEWAIVHSGQVAAMTEVHWDSWQSAKRQELIGKAPFEGAEVWGELFVHWSGSFHQQFAHHAVKVELGKLSALLDTLVAEGWKKAY